MMKRLILCLPLFLCAIACTQEIKEPETGSIVGIVADKTTGEPVGTVGLTLSPGGTRTTTGSDGSFNFVNLDAGSYSLSLEKEGYKNEISSVVVFAGKPTEAHLLIERIPAKMTVDKSELDFGIDPTNNSLSFSIINSDYATMSWDIGGLEEWIKVDPMKGELAMGKTATIIVSIDRNSEKIKPGENSSVIVIRSSSGHGSAEVSVKVIGEQKEAPSVNVLAATEITSSKAVLNGVITNVGVPSYTERGFYFSGASIDVNNVDSSPSVYKVSCPVNETPEFSYPLAELQTDKEYFVRAYVINRDGRVFSTNEISFKPSVSIPSVSVNDVSECSVSGRSAIFNGSITYEGDPVYTEKGFVYGTEPSPVVSSDAKIVVEGNSSGDFSVPVKNLNLDQTYYVRAYVRQRANIYESENTFYSQETVSFALKTTKPSVSAYDISSPNIEAKSVVLNGTIVNVGEPNYSEKGFVYSESPSPTISDNILWVEGTSSGSFSAPLTGLNLDKTYYVRAYVKQLDETYYSEECIQFSLETVYPESQMTEISECSYSGRYAKLSGEVTNTGTPAYSRRGFVYGFSSNPKIENDKYQYVTGSGIGAFSLYLSDLILDKQYFVRIFTEQEGDVIYSTNELNFTLSPVWTRLGVISVSEVENTSAKIACSIAEIGDPSYSEKGFVLNNSGNPDIDINLKRIVAEGSGSGDFSARFTGLDANTIFYVKAYVKQNGQVFYSSEATFKTGKKSSVVNTNAASQVLYTSARLNATVSSVGDPVYDRRGFYYSTNSNPTASNSTITLENANAQGDYSLDLNNLTEGTTYYYRAYVLQPNETSPILGSIVSFTTGHRPNVTTGGVINVTCSGSDISNLNWSATLYGGISDPGSPEYTSFGFVYGTVGNPEISDGTSTYITTTKFDQSGSARIFNTTVSGFQTDVHYYIRAVATTPLAVVYGEPVEFTPTVIAPAIRTYSTQCEQVNGTWAVAFVGVAASLGQPAATGLGFVYSLDSTPTVNETGSTAVSYTKIENQNGYYVFGAATSGIMAGKNYYVRAYAKTSVGYTYGEVLTFKTY